MKKYSFLIFLSAWCTPFAAHAYSAELFINTGSVGVNALEVTIHIPNGVQIGSLETGGSAILIWLKEPQVGQETNTISFSGISPGGFQGKQAVLSVTGEFQEGDLSRFNYSEVKALKADGRGTLVPATFFFEAKVVAEDLSPPEPFIPAISHSKDFFEDTFFLSFLAQDKGRGVDHYEYASTWFISPSAGAWQGVESPLLLSRLDVFKSIYIRAIDRAGNVREATLPGPYHYASLVMGIIIIICALVLTRRSFS